MEDRLAQEEEILALEAIFAEDLVLNGDATASHFSGTLSVPLTLPDDLLVVVKSWPPRKDAPLPHAAKLRWLPPVRIRFFLPDGYPSTVAPDINVDCRWLLPAQRRRLELKAQQIWTQNGHEVTLFEFTQWIQDDLLPSFKLLSDHQLTLWADEHEQSVGMVWDSLLAHEQKMVSLEFDRSSFDCGVCFTEHKGANCVKFQPCDHVFCKDCSRSYFEVLIKDNQTESLKCMDTSCGKAPGTEAGQLDESTVKELLGEELFERYSRLAEKNRLDKRRDIAWCPRPFCQKMALKDKDIVKMAVCTECAFAFCFVVSLLAS